MKNFQKTLKTLALLLPAIFMIFILSTACETEKVVTEIQEVHDTVYVNIISIDSIYASLDSVAQGGTITLTAQVSSYQAPQGAYTFAWFATGGTFSAATGDTVAWKAPDDPGVYVVTVHATNGTAIGIGSRMIGVGMYVPTTTPAFLGGDACSGCHAEKYAEWEGTAHAHAWATLQNSGHPAPYCNPCHSVGYEPAAMTGNSGYDEAPIAKFVNVQCENCHGPASEHPSNPGVNKPEVSYDVQNCGKCHDGEHHPFLTEWNQSPHNYDPYAESSYSCGGCHDGVAASIRLSGESAQYPLSSFYGSGRITERPDTALVPLRAVVCQTCHDPHNLENPGQLRTVANVPLVTANGRSPVISAGGVGKLCMHCHHARRGPESQIAVGSNRFGPHANPQADMLAGETAYLAVADPNFPWAGISHLNVQNSCKTCHLNMVEFGGGPGGAAVTGHEFIPKPEACVNCHGPITAFTDIMALEDFDGDGTIEGLQDEVLGLLDNLKEAIVASGLDTTLANPPNFLTAIGDTSISTPEQRAAGWNWAFVEEDKSKGVHNPDFAVQVLQQSILYIGGDLPKNARLVTGEKQVVGNW